MTSTIGHNPDAAVTRLVRRARQRPAGAFTLMELALVLVVIGVVLAISAPSLRGFFASRQAADAAMTVLTLTKQARSEAVTRGRPCRLNFDPAAGRFWLTVQQTGAFTPPSVEMARGLCLPEGVQASLRSQSPEGPLPYVQFQPTGRNNVAAIEIEGKQGEVYLVDCPSATEPFRIVSPSEAPL
jgi:Tfp pilus assembly protein FimT